MILKMAKSNGWKYVDKLSGVNVENIDIEHYNLTGILYDDAFLFYHTINHSRTIEKRASKDKDMNHKIPIIQIWAKKQNEEAKLYLSDLAVYLMSDEGKTIERIN